MRDTSRLHDLRLRYGLGMELAPHEYHELLTLQAKEHVEQQEQLIAAKPNSPPAVNCGGSCDDNLANSGPITAVSFDHSNRSGNASSMIKSLWTGCETMFQWPLMNENSMPQSAQFATVLATGQAGWVLALHTLKKNNGIHLGTAELVFAEGRPQTFPLSEITFGTTASLSDQRELEIRGRRAAALQQ